MLGGGATPRAPPVWPGWVWGWVGCAACVGAAGSGAEGLLAAGSSDAGRGAAPRGPPLGLGWGWVGCAACVPSPLTTSGSRPSFDYLQPRPRGVAGRGLAGDGHGCRNAFKIRRAGRAATVQLGE